MTDSDGDMKSVRSLSGANGSGSAMWGTSGTFSEVMGKFLYYVVIGIVLHRMRCFGGAKVGRVNDTDDAVTGRIHRVVVESIFDWLGPSVIHVVATRQGTDKNGALRLVNLNRRLMVNVLREEAAHQLQT